MSMYMVFLTLLSFVSTLILGIYTVNLGLNLIEKAFKIPNKELDTQTFQNGFIIFFIGNLICGIMVALGLTP